MDSYSYFGDFMGGVIGPAEMERIKKNRERKSKGKK